MSGGKEYYQLYRRSSIGMALTDSLDELIQNGSIYPQLALKVLATFDRCIADALLQHVRTRATAKGHLETYRFCDDVWTFIIENATFKVDHETISADKVKIVACNSKQTAE